MILKTLPLPRRDIPGFSVIESSSGRLVVVQYPSRTAIIAHTGFESATAALDWAKTEQSYRDSMRRANGRDMTGPATVVAYVIVLALFIGGLTAGLLGWHA